MAAAAIAHHEYIDAIAGAHVPRLGAQRIFLGGDGRAKGEHFLKRDGGESDKDNQQDEHHEHAYHAAFASIDRALPSFTTRLSWGRSRASWRLSRLRGWITWGAWSDGTAGRCRVWGRLRLIRV